jgi:hypothetical protein
MHATAQLSLARFTAKTRSFPALKMGCPFRDTTAPTKEGLSGDDKIVSNLHEQMSRRDILESSIPLSMVRGTI